MADVTAAMVKELRVKTGAGMMDCKKALVENDGDIEAATDWLRTKGLAAAAKKADRVAAEGLVGMATDGKSGALIEVNSETDFVGRNEQFQGFVSSLAGLVLATGDDMAALMAASYPEGSDNVADTLTHMIATIGENMSLRRAAKINVENGTVGSYMHGATATGVGRIGVLVGLESSADGEALQGLAKQVAMHIAASSPASLSKDDLDPEIVERERKVQIETARESGKPENIIEKMVEGRIAKFYKDVCLLEQTWVLDPDLTVNKALAAAAQDLGSEVKISGFVRFALGEGIVKEAGPDFAAEVAAQVGG
jgi:elongation factor Ts